MALVSMLTEPDGVQAYYDATRHPELLDAQLDVLTHGVFTDDSVVRAFRAAFGAAEASPAAHD
jgi:hypothetical protein